MRAPAPGLAGLTKPRPPPSHPLLSSIKRGVAASKPSKPSKKAAGAPNKRSGVQERPLRERVSHLLALMPYKRPELIIRLQRDGLSAADKDELDAVLLEVNLFGGMN